MIFVTVGMHPIGFERLVKKMDEIAAELEDEVIMQIGGTKYVPRNAKHFDFTTEQEMSVMYEKAVVVVTHAGAGVLLNVLEQGTPIVVVPRLKKYGEHIDDHQSELAAALEADAKVIEVYDIDQLKEAIGQAVVKQPQIVKDRRLVDALKGYIAQFEQSSLD